MARLSTLAKDRGIAAMFASTTTVGLLHDGIEEMDPGYERQLANLGPPEDGARTNVADVIFPAYHIRPESPINGWALFEGDTLLASGDLAPRTPESGDVIEILAGTLRVGLV